MIRLSNRREVESYLDDHFSEADSLVVNHPTAEMFSAVAELLLNNEGISADVYVSSDALDTLTSTFSHRALLAELTERYQLEIKTVERNGLTGNPVITSSEAMSCLVPDTDRYEFVVVDGEGDAEDFLRVCQSRVRASRREFDAPSLSTIRRLCERHCTEEMADVLDEILEHFRAMARPGSGPHRVTPFIAAAAVCNRRQPPLMDLIENLDIGVPPSRVYRFQSRLREADIVETESVKFGGPENPTVNELSVGRGVPGSTLRAVATTLIARNY